MFKSFFIHRHIGSAVLPKHSKPRGFTLKVDHDPNNPRNVIVRGAWCSAEDHFSRKEGRRIANAAKPETLNKRDLPELLATMENALHHCVPRLDINGVKYTPKWAIDQEYYYVLKYVV